MIPTQQEKSESKLIKYGELIVLGHNGCLKNIETAQSAEAKSSLSSSRRKSKFILKTRDKPNGVKPFTQHNCLSSSDINNLMLKNDHSVTYTLSRNHAVVVQYSTDEKTDMFQIGRSTESVIDFVVLDTIIPSQSKTTNKQQFESLFPNQPRDHLPFKNNIPQSTISRFSCRITVEREYPYTARIYAAGFDSSKRIFLGEKATKWKNEKGELDGVTTNGILIMHPPKGFKYNESISKINIQSEWLEVSVCGAVFNFNESRLSPTVHLNNNNNIFKIDKNEPIVQNTNKSNILKDGTLIDLCGATLLWRSADSLKHTPSKQFLEMYLENLNRQKPQCPVGFKTLIFPSTASPRDLNSNRDLTNNLLLNSNCKSIERTPMVYLKCGHVHGHHNWGIKEDNERECPLCRKVGPYVQLLIGLEPSFYCDLSHNNSIGLNLFKSQYAFLPCGHMASEETCKYWSKILVPQGATQGLWSICPFCAVILCEEQPVVKLIFQEGF